MFDALLLLIVQWTLKIAQSDQLVLLCDLEDIVGNMKVKVIFQQHEHEVRIHNADAGCTQLHDQVSFVVILEKSSTQQQHAPPTVMYGIHELLIQVSCSHVTLMDEAVQA